MTTPDLVTVQSWAWPEIREGDDLAALAADTVPLADGDIVVVASKVVSKAEGEVSDAAKADLIAADAVRVVARRGPTVIAETRHGLVLAAAGVDESNVDEGKALSLPRDPDRSARRLRAGLAAAVDVNVAVVVSDTAGRAWRQGQTDLAIGCAGLDPLLDLRGQRDARGRVLNVTMPALADEIAGMADLVKGKASGRPVAVVRGLGGLVLGRGEDGPGARALVRASADDMFGLGARDAAIAAVLRDDVAALARFPSRAAGDADPFAGIASNRSDLTVDVASSPSDGRAGDVARWTVDVCVRVDAHADAWLEAGRLLERVSVLAAAHRLESRPVEGAPQPPRGWRTVSRLSWATA